MSGWIKVEKDLETDPRVIRMAKALDVHSRNACTCDPCNAHALPGVTLVVGALARLWMYADSHARDDDTLDLSTGELDEWLGIPGFCALMPTDWLVVVDDSTLELPGYQEHNNTEAKKRALGQKRQEKYRGKQQRQSVTPRNAGASLDQTKTRPEETKTREIHERTRAATDAKGELPRPNRDLTPVASPSTRAHTFGESELMDAFAVVRSSYPNFSGRQDWPNAEHHWRMRIEQGATPQQLIAGVQRYAAFVDAGGVSGPAFVMTPGKFFSAVDKPWSQPWTPPPTKAEVRLGKNLTAAEEFMRRTEPAA